VTVLTRKARPDGYGPNVNVAEVDYDSVPSLTTALRGIDGVVSAVGPEGIDGQGTLIEAAVAAGVKRFIPSEFGSVTTHPDLQSMPHYSSIFRVRQLLQKKADAGDLSWTVLACGGFLEFVFDAPFILDFKNHAATLYDDGNNRITSTSLKNIGKAIATIFSNPEATKDRVLRLSEVIVTQNQLLGIARELQPDIKWNFKTVETDELLQEGLAAPLDANGHPEHAAVMKILMGTVMAGDRYGAAFDQNDNKLLGVSELGEGELRDLVASKLA
jgi:uncharacterized protein YbjT (DUF2867 family)